MQHRDTVDMIRLTHLLQACQGAKDVADQLLASKHRGEVLTDLAHICLCKLGKVAKTDLCKVGKHKYMPGC